MASSRSNDSGDLTERRSPGSRTSYFKFDTRLDYYMRLAEGPSPLHGAPHPSYDGPSAQSRGGAPDTEMLDLDPALEAADVTIPTALQMQVGVGPVAAGGPPAPAQGLHRRGEVVSSRPSTGLRSGSGSTPGRTAAHSLASRAGIFHEFPNRRKSYFGPTSYLHILQPAAALWRPFANSGEEGSRGNRGPLIPGHKLLEEQIEDSFFTWDNLFLDYFGKEIYLREKARYEAGRDVLFYSPALGNAILAVGSLYLPDVDHEAAPSHSSVVAKDFATRARRMVVDELECPSVSTVLTLIVLCSLSAAEALDNQGWFYSGTALRLISTLGLDQEDAITYPAEDKNALRALQRSIVKGVICLDAIWRSWCGRLQDLTRRRLPSFGRDVGVSGPEYPKCLATSRFATLMLLHREILHFLATNEGRIDVLQKALSDWKNSCLEPTEQTDVRSSVVDLQSLVHYHGIQIQLANLHPFTPQSTPSSPRSMPPSSIPSPIQSANEISRLQHLFRRTHGFAKLHPFTIHPMLAACLVSVSDLATTGESRQARQNLVRGIQAFGEVGERLNVGLRSLVVVTGVHAEWQERST